MYLYADNAATTQLCAAAKRAMAETADAFWANPSSLHAPGQKAKEKLEEARKAVATCIGAQPETIIFTSGGSEADTMALFTAARLGERQGKRHLISTRFEHHAVLHALEALEKEGFEITLLDVQPNGRVASEAVEKAIRPDTALVSILYVNNEIGTVQPIREIGAICRTRGVLFHTDAVQAVGHLPVDVEADNVDLLSLSGHKFHGPKGIGALYARRGIALQNVIYGGAQERGKRPGTENLPAAAGMAAALQEANAHLAENTEKWTAMREKLIAALEKIPHSRLNGDREHSAPGIVSFCFEGIEGEALLLLLDAQGIAASSGSACTSGSLEPSHVLLALGLPHEVAHGSLRLSFGAFNTLKEVDTILEVLPGIISYLRDGSPLWEALQLGRQPHWI